MNSPRTVGESHSPRSKGCGDELERQKRTVNDRARPQQYCAATLSFYFQASPLQPSLDLQCCKCDRSCVIGLLAG